MTRFRPIRLVMVALVVTAAALPAHAGGAPPWEPTPGGWISGPLEYVTTVPLDGAGGVGATTFGDHLYVTTFRSFSIYDISSPESPQLLSTVPLPAQLFNEQPDTNGEIAILTTDFPEPALQVWDVSNPASPARTATLDLPKTDHMWTCVLSCAYAYGARGTIVDLSEPESPRIVGDWADGVAISSFHAIEEVAPGRVLTGTYPVLLLDGRSRPQRPRIEATIAIKTGPRRLLGLGGGSPDAPPAFLDWPENARERIALVSVETPFSGACNEDSGGFATYDTAGWKRTRTFRFADDYKIDTNGGTYSNGRAPHKAFGCSAYAFEVPPSYDRSGRVAVAWFEDGMRLLEVDSRGRIEEIGGFVPLGGSTSAPVWVDDEYLYLVDLNRGIDILRARPENSR